MFASRWMPSVLAATHMLTLGFMMEVMLGALIQMLPVVAGANLAKPLLLARIVHGGLTLGVLLLAAGFLLGLLQRYPDEWARGDASDADRIDGLVAGRVAARQAKDFAEADRIRKALAAEGVEIMDGPNGSTWRRV